MRCIIAMLIALVLAAPALAQVGADADLRALSAIVVDTRRSIIDRRAALARSVLLRREMLRDEHRTDRAALHIDQVEALVLTGPALDAADAFALAGWLEPSERESLTRALDEADALLAEARPKSPEEKQRCDVLRTVAAARRADVAPQDKRAAKLEASIDEASAMRLAPALRDTVRLALARLALDDHPEVGERLLNSVAESTDAASITRCTARALFAIARAQRGDRSSEAIALQLVEQNRTATGFERLLVADALARVALELGKPPDAAMLAWTALLESSTDPNLPALRAAIVRRVRLLARPPALADAASAAPLVLVSFAPELAKQNPAAIAAALDSARAKIAPGTPLVGLLRFEYGRALAQARQLSDAVDALNELAVESAGDPIGADAIDLAIEIAAELALAPAPSDADRSRAKACIAAGLQQFFDHPRRDRWRLLRAEIALAEHRFGDARADLASIASPTARLAQALSWMGDAAASELDAERRDAIDAATDCLSRAGSVSGGRRDLIEGWQALLEGHPDVAERRLASALGDDGIAAHDLGTALRLFLRAQLTGHDSVIASPTLQRAIERAPSAAKPVLVDHLRRVLAGLSNPSDAMEIAKRRMGALLPLSDAVVAITSDDERVVIAEALLACDMLEAAHRVTAALLATSPSDQRRMLLHARAAEAHHRADAIALYEALCDDAPALSPPWWTAQAGHLRLATDELEATPGTDRIAFQLLLDQVAELHRRDAGFGGEPMRASIETTAARLRKRLEVP